jgi:hypothetical protein
MSGDGTKFDRLRGPLATVVRRRRPLGQASFRRSRSAFANSAAAEGHLCAVSLFRLGRRQRETNQNPARYEVA